MTVLGNYRFARRNYGKQGWKSAGKMSPDRRCRREARNTGACFPRGFIYRRSWSKRSFLYQSERWLRRTKCETNTWLPYSSMPTTLLSSSIKSASSKNNYDREYRSRWIIDGEMRQSFDLFIPQKIVRHRLVSITHPSG